MPRKAKKTSKTRAKRKTTRPAAPATTPPPAKPLGPCKLKVRVSPPNSGRLTALMRLRQTHWSILDILRGGPATRGSFPAHLRAKLARTQELGLIQIDNGLIKLTSLGRDAIQRRFNPRRDDPAKKEPTDGRPHDQRPDDQQPDQRDRPPDRAGDAA